MSRIRDTADILGTSWRGRMRDVCLVDAFRSMGLKVAYQSNGPFYASNAVQCRARLHNDRVTQLQDNKSMIVKYFLKVYHRRGGEPTSL